MNILPLISFYSLFHFGSGWRTRTLGDARGTKHHLLLEGFINNEKLDNLIITKQNRSEKNPTVRGDQAPRDEADIDTGLYYRLKYVILCDLPGKLHVFFVPSRLFSIQHQIENRQRNNQRIPKLSPHTKKSLNSWA